MLSKIKRKLVAAIVALMAMMQLKVGAFLYHDGDLLLVFRDGQDVLFDLGSVSNYLGLASGTQVVVTNWNAVEVTNNLGTFARPPYSQNITFALIATTAYTAPSPALWVTDGTSNITTRLDIYGPRFQAIWSRINGLGSAVNLVSPGSSNDYVASFSFSYSEDSYSYAMGSQQIGAPVSRLGGNLPFSIENIVPGSSCFYQLNATNDPLPPASKIGTFSIDVNGNLTFTAGGGN